MYCSVTSWSFFLLSGSIDFAPDDHGALSCCIHKKLMCLFIVCETMLTIGESRAISHANVTQQQAQKVAVHPHRWAWNRHEPHALVWANSRFFMEACYRWENTVQLFILCSSVPNSDQEWLIIKLVPQLRPAEKSVIEIYAYQKSTFQTIV